MNARERHNPRRGPAYVYRCFDADGVLLYVGSTIALTSRLETHRMNAFWAADVAKVRAQVFKDKGAAMTEEKGVIRAELPRWNRAHKWTPGDPRQHWSFEDYWWFAVSTARETPNPSSRLKAVRKEVLMRFGRDLDVDELQRLHDLCWARFEPADTAPVVAA